MSEVFSIHQWECYQKTKSKSGSSLALCKTELSRFELEKVRLFEGKVTILAYNLVLAGEMPLPVWSSLKRHQAHVGRTNWPILSEFAGKY